MEKLIIFWKAIESSDDQMAVVFVAILRTISIWVCEMLAFSISEVQSSAKELT